jgi:hypothetical protein
MTGVASWEGDGNFSGRSSALASWVSPKTIVAANKIRIVLIAVLPSWSGTRAHEQIASSLFNRRLMRKSSVRVQVVSPEQGTPITRLSEFLIVRALLIPQIAAANVTQF